MKHGDPSATGKYSDWQRSLVHSTLENQWHSFHQHLLQHVPCTSTWCVVIRFFLYMGERNADGKSDTDSCLLTHSIFLLLVTMQTCYFVVSGRYEWVLMVRFIGHAKHNSGFKKREKPCHDWSLALPLPPVSLSNTSTWNLYTRAGI